MPLDAPVRALFEPRFKQDFSRVRIHRDDAAARSARRLDARAYTLGNHIVLGQPMDRLDSAAGLRLLAHELAHVVQQQTSGAPTRELGADGDLDEQRAEQVADAFAWGGLRPHYGTVAADVAWYSGMRPDFVLTAPVPAGARIQRVQLTYDDGPDGAGNTRRVLDELR